MFGNNNTSNIFGAQAPTTLKKPLFGNNNTDNLFNTQQGSGGLFGNANASTGGGLFSNSNQQNNLFNTNSNLFSNNNTTNFFGNNQNSNNLFNTHSNSNSFFSNTNNNQNLFQNNNNNTNGLKDSTYGKLFNGENIDNKKEKLNFMSITALPEFSYSSNEELRLADYEKKQTGNIMKFKINDTSNNKLKIQNNSNSNSGGLFTSTNTTTTSNIFGTNSSSIFGNNNTTNQTREIFGNNQSNSLFGNITNNNQGNSLFGNTNNKQGINMFGNTLTSNQNGGLFGNNTSNNQGNGFFGNINNNQENSLFGNNLSNNTQSGLFGNNNKKSEGLFDNSTNNSINNNKNTTSDTGLFWGAGTQNNIFGNNLNNNQTEGGLFGNKNQSGNIFGNNTNIFGGGLFENSKNNNYNQGLSLFGNNRDKIEGGILGNTNNNTQGNSLFNNDKNSSSFLNDNNITKTGIFENSTTKTNSFFTNNSINANSNNVNTGGIFGKINTENNSLENNTPSLFKNTLTNNSNTEFGNINSNKNIEGLFIKTNNSLFNGNNSNTNTDSNSVFNCTNNNQTLASFTNNNNQQICNNMSNNQDISLYSEIAYEDIVNPLNYIYNQKNLKLSPEDEIISKSIVDTIQKQKSIEDFLEDLDKKYKNNENIDNDNNDILASYGTYLSSPTNYDKNQPTLNRNLNIRKNNDIVQKSYINMKYRNSYNEKNNEISIYSKARLNESILKINEIYDEYERYKNKFMNNNENIQSENSQINGTNYNNNKVKKENNSNNHKNIYNKSTSCVNKNEMIANDEGLYQRNLMEFNKLSNYNISKDNKENEDNNEILIMNNLKKEEDNKNKNKNNNKTVDLIIKYRLPNEEDNNNKNNSKIHLDNVNQSIKIQTLKEEIKERLNNELKSQNLDKNHSIEKISLLIPGIFLDDNKKLLYYNLAEKDYNIQAYITYNSKSAQNKDELPINKNNKLEESHIKINEEMNLNEDELAPIDLIPKLTKEGYKCSPSIKELSRKTVDELRNVENFKIFNKHGEVEFKEPVNLLGLNLDNQVTIEKTLIDTGDKLDYWAIYKLFNFKTKENGLKKHKIELEKYGGNFLYYKNNELAWEYNGKKEKIEKN